MSSRLPNYLLANRKRLNLSQGVVAFLLGVASGAKVSRHERFARQPSLEAALAYEIIFKRAVCEVFDGLYQEIERQVATRAKALLKEIQPNASDKQITRLREILAESGGSRFKREEPGMTATRPKHVRILAIAPSSRGFGFALLEGHDILADWGIKSVKGDKNVECLVKFQVLITHYVPQLVVMEDVKCKEARRAKRICDLLEQIASVSSEKGIKVMTCSRKDLRATLGGGDQTTKQEVAEIVAATFPEELESRLPSERKAWESENYHMAIFEAAALLLVARSSRRRDK